MDSSDSNLKIAPMNHSQGRFFLCVISSIYQIMTRSIAFIDSITKGQIRTRPDFEHQLQESKASNDSLEKVTYGISCSRIPNQPIDRIILTHQTGRLRANLKQNCFTSSKSLKLKMPGSSFYDSKRHGKGILYHTCWKPSRIDFSLTDAIYFPSVKARRPSLNTHNKAQMIRAISVYVSPCDPLSVLYYSIVQQVGQDLIIFTTTAASAATATATAPPITAGRHGFRPQPPPAHFHRCTGGLRRAGYHGAVPVARTGCRDARRRFGRQRCGVARAGCARIPGSRSASDGLPAARGHARGLACP
jgi:hypothetical protein